MRSCGMATTLAATCLLGLAIAPSAERSEHVRRHCELEPSRPAPSPPPVTTLRTRDTEVAIYSIDGELRYTVLDASGRVLAHHVDELTFIAGFPNLAEQLDRALAEDAWIDASAPDRP